MFNSPQFKAALFRAGIAMTAILITLSATLVQFPDDWRVSVAGALTALIPILVRLGEGLYDADRAQVGNIKESDVGFDLLTPDFE